MQKLHHKCYFGMFYTTCRFMQKYKPPDASNFEKYIKIIFLYCNVKIISEMQKCI